VNDKRREIRIGPYFQENWDIVRLKVPRAEEYLEQVKWRLSINPLFGDKGPLQRIWTIEITWPWDITDGIFVYDSFDDDFVTLESVKSSADFLDRRDLGPF
jgi:hypothetical protein